MSDAEKIEEGFAKAAEQLAKGERTAAVATLVGLLATIATGNPIVGGVAAGATHRVVTHLVDSAEQRMAAAEREIDDERERARQWTRYLHDALASLFEALHDQGNEQFVQLNRVMHRDLASKHDVQEVLLLLQERLPEQATDAELLAAYRDHLQTRHSRPPGLFREHLTDLDTVYVELDVDISALREYARSAGSHAYDADAFYDVDAFSNTEATRRNRTLRELMELPPLYGLAPGRVEHQHESATANRWVVLGHPGSGKSTLARHLAWELAAVDGTLPVYAPLPALMNDRRDPFDHAEHELQHAKGQAVGAGLAAVLRRRGTQRDAVWLLLDGLDEVSAEQRAEAATLLHQWANDWPRVTIAVFTRRVGYQPLGPSYSRQAHVQALSPDQQARLLHKWLHGDPASVTRVQTALEQSQALRDACSVPLLLSLLAFLEQRRGVQPTVDLPANQRGLFTRSIEVLLERGQTDDASGVRNPRQARQLLQALSLRLHDEPGPSWSFTKLAELTEELPDASKRFGAHATWQDADAFLKDIAERSGILAPHDGANAPWRFFHRQFGELLAAEALSAQGRAAVLTRARQLAPGTLPRWAEVLGFACELDGEPLEVLKALHAVSEDLALRVLPEVDGVDLVAALELLSTDGKWDGDFLVRIIERWSETDSDFDGNRIARWLIGQVNEARSTERLAHLYYALEHLKTKHAVQVDELFAEGNLREGFFRKCQRWPAGGPQEPELVAIPAGKFRMGSPDTEAQRHENEGPQHWVTVSGFELSPTAVTNREYQEFDPRHEPHLFDGVKPERVLNHPVVNVSWWEAYLYTRWRGGRLPTEAEWEYACRAGTTTPFSFGEEITTDQVNYHGDFPYAGGSTGEFRRQTVAVGMLPANGFGLHEMHGNVWEWCSDWWDVYAEAPAVDPCGPEQGRYRVLRGGSWIYYARNARSAYRNPGTPDYRVSYVGFRFARGHKKPARETSETSQGGFTPEA